MEGLSFKNIFVVWILRWQSAIPEYEGDMST